MKQCMNVNLCACGTERETERGKWEREHVWLTWYACSGAWGGGGAGLTVEKFHTLEERMEQIKIPSCTLPYFTHSCRREKET